MGASPTSLVVTSMARTSNVRSSIPRWILRQSSHGVATGSRDRGEGRFVPPCLRVQRDNSPPDCCLIRLTPLALTFDLDPGAVDQEVQRGLRTAMGELHREGRLAAAQRGSKAGTVQSSPISRSRLSTNPVVGRSAMPKSTFIVRPV